MASLPDRTNAFQRVQLYLVLWFAVVSVVNGGMGVTFDGYEEPASVRLTSWAAIVIHVVSAVVHLIVAFRAARRFPLWERPKRAFAIHLGLLAGLLAYVWASDLLRVQLGGVSPYPPTFYIRHAFEYIVYLLFAHGMLYGEHRTEREREELRLRAEMSASTAARTRARVRALRMEWSPHFLTGTLEAIGDLLSRDAAAAKRMLLGLSAVLRRVLAPVRTDGVRLEQEMALVDEVLRVEAMRRPGLVVEREIDDAAWELPVPHMALLTLVYDALRGGEVERIRIAAVAEGEEVRLCVEAEGVRLELCCAPEPRDPAPDEHPAAHGTRAAAPPVAAGRMLEVFTYAALILLNTALALYTGWTSVASGKVSLQTPSWVFVAGSAFYTALWWTSFAVAAHFLTARWPIRQESWPRRLGIHALAVVGVALVNAIAYGLFQFHLVHGGSVLIALRLHWGWGDLAVYPPLVGIAHGFAFAREYQARRLSELRLRSLLAESELERSEAELQALKAELNPHFLFNALNTVSSLMHTRPDEARRVVAHLAALLRRVLESASLQEVSVEEEVEFIRLYLEIEQARFGDALRVEYRLDPATLGASVPHLLIQPLVENAVKHGLRPRGGTGRVTLSAHREGSFLHLTVADDGVGPSPAPRPGGTGLANVRARLRELYGEAHAFELAAAPAGGAQARVRIPFTEHPMAPA